MDDTKKWIIVVAGLVAVVGHWLPGYWLDVVGGAVAAITALMAD